MPGVQVIGASSLIEVIIWLRGGPPPSLPAVPEPPPGRRPRSPWPRSWTWRRCSARRRHGWRRRSARRAGTTCPCSARPERARRCWPSGCRRSCPPLDTAAAIEVTSIHSVAGQLPPGIGADDHRRRSAPRTTPHRWPRSSAAAAASSAQAPRRLAHHGHPLPRRGTGVSPRRPRRAAPAAGIGRGGDRPRPGRRPSSPPGSPSSSRPTRARARRPRGRARPAAPAPRPPAAATSPGSPGRCSTGSTSRSASSRSPAATCSTTASSPSRPPSSPSGSPPPASGCAARLAGTPWRVNAEVPGTVLRRSFAPAAGALTSLDRAMELGQVSARGADKIVRVAWSLADLAGEDRAGSRPGQPRDRTMARSDTVNEQAHRRDLRPRGPDLPRGAGRPLARRGCSGSTARPGHSTRSSRARPLGTAGPPNAGGPRQLSLPHGRARDAVKAAMERWRVRLSELPTPGAGARLPRVGDQAHRARATRNGRGSWPTSGTTSPTRCGCAATRTCGSAACARSRSSARGPRPPTAPTSRPSSPRPSPRAAGRWSPAARSASTPRRTGARSAPTG